VDTLRANKHTHTMNFERFEHLLHMRGYTGSAYLTTAQHNRRIFAGFKSLSLEVSHLN